MRSDGWYSYLRMTGWDRSSDQARADRVRSAAGSYDRDTVRARPESTDGTRSPDAGPARTFAPRPLAGPVPRLDFQEHLADLEAQRSAASASIGRSTRIPSFTRWCDGSSWAACPRTGGGAFLFTNVTDAKGGATTFRSWSARSRPLTRIYAIGMGQPVADIGEAWMRAIARPIAPIRSPRRAARRSCSRRRPRGPRRPCAPAGAGLDARFDSAPVSDGDALRHPRSRQRHPEHGHVSCRPESGRPAGGAHGRARGNRRRRLLHWLKYRARRHADADRDRVGCAPVVMFTGPQKLAVDMDELGVAGALAGAPIEMAKAVTIDSTSGVVGNRDRRADRSRQARA